MRPATSRTRGPALAWGLFLLALSAWLAVRVATGPALDANLMSLLPTVERSPTVEAAAERLRIRFERRVTLLVGGKSPAAAKSSALAVGKALLDSGQFSDLVSRHEGGTLDQVLELYLPHRFDLMSEASRAQLRAGDSAGFERSVIARYFNPVSTVRSDLIEQDPLQLLPGFLEEVAANRSGRLSPDDGFLLVESDGRTYALLTGSLKDSPFSFRLQDSLMPVFERLAKEHTLLRAGVLFHAAAGAETAKGEISRVGAGALLGIVILFLLVFRSARPLALSLFAIAVGCLGGFAVCLALFGQVYLLTLVFGASLIGISVDYSLHYFCEHFRLRETWTPGAALAHVFPGITLGLATSVIGFAGLLFTPFPGMQQMAVFSGTGLIFAYLSVVTFYPLLGRALRFRHMAGPLRWSAVYARQFEHGRGRVTLLALVMVPFLALGAFGISRLAAEDDIRQLQAVDPAVLAEEARLQSLVGQDLSSQVFLVEGANEAELLAREEALVAQLLDQASAGGIAGHVALSDVVPSPQRRSENRALLASLLEGEDSLLYVLAERIGLPDPVVDRYVEDFVRSPEPKPEILSRWLESPLAAPYRHLWLGTDGERYISAVGLRQVHEPETLRALADLENGVTFVDTVGELSSLFRDSRRQAGLLTLASYVLVGLVLVWRYGFRGGLAVMIAPVAAAVASLGFQGFIGEPLSLFNVLALLLVLGIGVDYGIFFRETGVESPSTLVAIALSSITTLLAFGLLTLSQTQAVHAFGLTILVGIVVAFLLSPTAASGRRSNLEMRSP